MKHNKLYLVMADQFLSSWMKGKIYLRIFECESITECKRLTIKLNKTYSVAWYLIFNYKPSWSNNIKYISVYIDRRTQPHWYENLTINQGDIDLLKRELERDEDVNAFIERM